MVLEQVDVLLDCWDACADGIELHVDGGICSLERLHLLLHLSADLDAGIADIASNLRCEVKEGSGQL